MPARPRSRTLSNSAAPPDSRSASLTTTSLKVRFAAPRLSANESRWRDTPPASARTRYSSSVPAERAETTKRWAAMPSITKTFSPDNLPPTTSVSTLCGSWCRCSSTASVTMAVPSATLGSQAWFCPALPPSTNADAPVSPDAMSGEAVSVRPSSSSTRARSMHPRFEPPYSSGTIVPAQPIAAISVQTAGS